MRKPSSPVGHLKIIMHKLRSVTLLCAGICAGVLSTVGITAYAEKQSAAPLPLAEIRQFTSAFNAIKDFYVDDVSDAKLLQSAVDGMVSGLDPHSSFLDVEGYKDMTESTQGSFGGLGLEVTKDPAGVRVISPIDDTPAARAGMRAGDIITRIDGKSVADMSLNAAVKLMRGQPNTKIELVVARKGANKPLNFSLVRALIKTQSVKMKKLDEKVGYIRISQFQERTAEDLSKYLDELAKDGHLEGLVLDLRNDPGGLLQAAIGVSAAFLPKGSDVVSTKGRQAQSDYTFKAVEADYRAGNAVRAHRRPDQLLVRLRLRNRGGRPAGPQARDHHGRPLLRQGLRADHHADEVRRQDRRREAHDSTLLHAVGPLDSGQGHHPRHLCRRHSEGQLPLLPDPRGRPHAPPDKSG